VPVAVEPGGGGVVLAFEIVRDGRLARYFKHRLVALADPAVLAVHHQRREWRLAASVTFQHDEVENFADPVAKGNRRANTRRTLDLLSKIAVYDQAFVGASHLGEEWVGMACPDSEGLALRNKFPVVLPPITPLRHQPS
jgi:hypothetical protein